LPAAGNLPQLIGSCLKENQDLISEILDKTIFVFSSVYLTGSGSKTAGCCSFDRNDDQWKSNSKNIVR
jgi:hypothetical protein